MFPEKHLKLRQSSVWCSKCRVGMVVFTCSKFPEWRIQNLCVHWKEESDSEMNSVEYVHMCMHVAYVCSCMQMSMHVYMYCICVFFAICGMKATVVWLEEENQTTMQWEGVLSWLERQILGTSDPGSISFDWQFEVQRKDLDPGLLVPELSLLSRHGLLPGHTQSRTAGSRA